MKATRIMNESSSSNISVTAKQLREIIRDEILREIARKRDCTDSKGKKGKWVLLTKKKPHKKLGCHTSKKGAIDQERAIKASGG